MLDINIIGGIIARMKRLLLVVVLSLSLVFFSNKALAYETYYFLIDPSSPSDSQTITQSTVPMNYNVWTSMSSNTFHNFMICPFVESDYGDYEILYGNCSAFYIGGFNQGSYYETNIPTNAQLLYPGVNNIGCIVVSDIDDNYQLCSDSTRVRINYTGTDFPVYRFWSNTKQHHFYTINHVEKRTIVDTYDANVWNYEHIAWTAQKYNGGCSTGSPVFRFWSDQKQGHFYTISESEKNQIQATYPSNVWRYEGIAYCAPPYTGNCDYGYAPVFRFWSDEKQGHFYTISETEKNEIQAKYPSNVWRYESIAFCAKP